ncbi:AIPR family protein [Akkermansiaceae bacterium]|nr:AIPR family protein [Akkermansiaceae bacterium]
MSETIKFYRELQSEVIDFAQGGTDDVSGFKENAFTDIISQDLSAAGIVESPVVCFFEAGPVNRTLKINAYSLPEEDTQLDLICTVYTGGETPRRINAKDIDQAYGKLTRALERAVSGHHEEMEPGSDAYAMIYDIWNSRERVDRVRLLLVTDGEVVQRKEKERKETIGNYTATYEIWDLERLRRFRSSGTTHESIEIDLSHLPNGGVPCVQTPNDELGYNTVTAVLPGHLLFALYDEYGQRLLELNVRSYLQARGKVNAGILETLFDHPERFLAYNNGITIVAEDLDIGPLKDGTLGIKSINGLQVVNGGQTTASIHRAGKGKEKIKKFVGRTADLSKVFVQAKITVIDRSQFDIMVPLISRYANSQNTVSEVDLRANHPYHVGIERVSRKTWAPGEQSMWFYERARGSYQTKKASEATTTAREKDFEKRYPPRQRFSKEDVARYENAWQEEPHVVSKGGQKNFAGFMSRVGDLEEGWTPSLDEYKKLIGKAIIYRQTQKIVLSLKADIPAFRNAVVAYTVSALAHKTARRIDLESIWDRQDLSEALRTAITNWALAIAAAMIESAGSRNPTEWFKKKACWDVVKNQNLPISEDLNCELSGSEETVVETPVGRKGKTRKETLTPEDQTNIARCVELNADDWMSMIKWAQGVSSIEEWQLDIASTLLGQATRDWNKPPSKRQAASVCEVISQWKAS